MNQSVVYTEDSDPITCAEVISPESLIGKIIAILKVITKIHRPQFGAGAKHQSFMDANLLDDVMGPEISRTLRR